MRPIEPSRRRPETYKTKGAITHFVHAPGSPRRRQLDQGSPPATEHTVPLIRPGQEFMGEVIPMLNYAAYQPRPERHHASLVPRSTFDHRQLRRRLRGRTTPVRARSLGMWPDQPRFRGTQPGVALLQGLRQGRRQVPERRRQQRRESRRRSAT
jgi:hypothetical protein